ncbi:cyclic nucleotide-gated ion channel 1-like protein [Cinnamomum micranthum f. kanehirae]|uniref:Cyclic nucleotide-gated ion channel 1-like protein n=1 Tax=Cinnamomum micranthum f. kanehirae TaxID=337451 RepID=A0A3S3P4L1_9MAGN|nr:cyclic nucleotide-gated ion channel 1-like protein [Cinnamomum micranthum f. kanehirae]
MLFLQTYLQSTTARLEEMRVKWQDAEQWMSQCLLPESLKERICRYEQYKWQETRMVDEEHLLRNLPTDLRRDINRHCCLALLMRVSCLIYEFPISFVIALSSCSTQGSYIVREGDPVDEMLFIEQGKLESCTTNGELFLTWALSPHPSSILPTSTRTVRALTEVKAFALKGDDLKFYGSEFRRLYGEELKHTFRYYSQQWRTWVACYKRLGASTRRSCCLRSLGVKRIYRWS